MTIRPKVVAVVPGERLSWVASLPGLIGGEHRFELTPRAAGTRLVQSETYRGLLVPFAGRTLARAQASFQALNEALKNEAESR